MEGTKEKLGIIFKIINLLIEKSAMHDNIIGNILLPEIKEIIEKQKLFENIEEERISSFDKKYIKLEEFEDSVFFYDFLYKLFLNKIFKMIKSNQDSITLFKTFNQAYFYKKFLKYISQFIGKYPETLSDDIIKEKLYEMVHSLDSNDKMYSEDFFFYISINYIHYHYENKDIPFSEFNKFNDISFENKKIKSLLNQIKDEKSSIIDLCCYYMKRINTKSNLIKIFEIILNEIEENKLFKKMEFDKMNWDEIATEEEKKLIKYLEENQSENEIKKLYEYLEADPIQKDIFQFYYLNKMESFLSLPEEDKYIIINSFNKKIDFYEQVLNYKSLKDSYNEGMEKENTLQETIKNMIENKEFFNNIKEILISEKVVDYCKNPLQYILDNSEIKIYDEKEKERKKKDKEENKEKKEKSKKSPKDEPIKKFIVEKDKDNKDSKENEGNNNDDDEEMPNLFSISPLRMMN